MGLPGTVVMYCPGRPLTVMVMSPGLCLGWSTVTAVPIPFECVDGFTEAYYDVPEAFSTHDGCVGPALPAGRSRHSLRAPIGDDPPDRRSSAQVNRLRTAGDANDTPEDPRPGAGYLRSLGGCRMVRLRVNSASSISPRANRSASTRSAPSAADCS